MKNVLRRYWLPFALIIIGLLVVLSGVGTATVWRPSDRVNLSLPEANKQQLIASRAGVMDLYSSNAKIQASSSGKVVIAVGKAENVAGWVAGQPYTEITGQASAKQFKAQDQAAKGETKLHSPLEPGGTDQWIQVEEGNGSATLNWVNREGNWSFLVWSEKGTPKLKVSWNRQIHTPLLWPLTIAGAVVIVLGLLIALGLNRISAAAKKEAAEAAKRRAEMQKEGASGAIPMIAPSLSSVTTPPSRRELREARSRGEENIEVDGIKFPTGLTPVIKLDEDGKPIAPDGYGKADTPHVGFETNPQTPIGEAEKQPADPASSNATASGKPVENNPQTKHKSATNPNLLEGSEPSLEETVSNIAEVNQQMISDPDQDASRSFHGEQPEADQNQPGEAESEPSFAVDTSEFTSELSGQLALTTEDSTPDPIPAASFTPATNSPADANPWDLDFGDPDDDADWDSTSLVSETIPDRSADDFAAQAADSLGSSASNGETETNENQHHSCAAEITSPQSGKQIFQPMPAQESGLENPPEENRQTGKVSDSQANSESLPTPSYPEGTEQPPLEEASAHLVELGENYLPMTENEPQLDGPSAFEEDELNEVWKTETPENVALSEGAEPSSNNGLKGEANAES